MCSLKFISLVCMTAAAAEEPPDCSTHLDVAETRFTLNGKPTFLLGLSYYGALGAPEEFIQHDLDDMERHRVNWIRVWATWAAFGNDVSAVDASGAAREPYLGKLRWLIAECDRRGIVVDVTLSRGNAATGPARLQSLDAHRQAVETITGALQPHRNWYLDLSNERNIQDQRFTSFEDLKELRQLVRQLDPKRLVTASHAGDISGDDLRQYLSTVQVDFITPHRPRDARSPAQTEAQSKEYHAMMDELGRARPVHYQEPFRRGFGSWHPQAADFAMDLHGAVAGGAAGWCLHNGAERDRPDGRPRRSFDLRDRRLFAQLDEEEQQVLPEFSLVPSSSFGPRRDVFVVRPSGRFRDELKPALRTCSWTAPRLQVGSEEQTEPGELNDSVVLEGPTAVPRFDVAEFVVRITKPPWNNPFTDVELAGVFTQDNSSPILVTGFADSADGTIFRLRFAPPEAGVKYGYNLTLKGGGIERGFTGELRSQPSNRAGPVIVDSEQPKHFIYAGSRQPFYHLGYTAYHLLDPSNDDDQVDATIDYCAKNGFNKIRFLLTGYPRDSERRTSSDVEFGVPDPWKAPNYGARPGQVNPLPAWLGKPHAYDFTRFNVAHWQRVDRAVRRMRALGIVATCIVTIEKQNLPQEYGRLTEHELRLYRYAIARLAAFDNVWWDLGNEHNEYRDAAWGNAMGAIVKKADPYRRLASAHAYADFFYADSPWADFIITQQYGDENEVHDWALKHRAIAKPYINEEYGYEGRLDKSGHGQNRDRVRRCHWAIAMAGGYATYGDWSDGVSYFYMGEAGPGQAAVELKHLRTFFESLPFRDLAPNDDLISHGFCLAQPGKQYIFHFPSGGTAEIDLSGAALTAPLVARWFDPRTGHWLDGPALSAGKHVVTTPNEADWLLYVRVVRPED